MNSELGMLMAEWIWPLDEFDRVSGHFKEYHLLTALSDYDTRSLLELNDLGNGDVYDIPDSPLAEISARFDLKISPKDSEYFLSRVSPEPR
ncbi:hypothetical protein ACWFMI_01825 [Nocardiopsis terrae]